MNNNVLKLLSTITAITWASAAQATAFQSVMTPWAGLYPVVEPINPAFILAASQDRALQKITLQEYSRAGNGIWSDFMREWRAIPYKEISSENLLWFPQQSKMDNTHLNLLVSGANCIDFAACEIKQHALLRIKLEDKSLTSTIITPSCDVAKAPEMIWVNAAFRINDGCNTVYSIEGTSLTKTLSQPDLAMMSFSKERSGIAWGHDAKEKPGEVAFFDAVSGTEIGQVKIQGIISRCVEVLSQTSGQIAIDCESSDGDKKIHTRVLHAETTEQKDVTAISPEILAHATVGEHRYIQLSSEKSQSFLNTSATSSKDIYSQRDLPTQKLSSSLSTLQRPPEAKTEPTKGFFVLFPAAQGFERVSFMMYDLIEDDYGPFLGSSTSLTLPSNNKIEVPWKIMDEETLPMDLTVSDDGAPSWLIFNAQSRNASAYPRHADSGNTTFKQKISDSKNSIEVSWDVTVTLSPFEVMVFEPHWFEQWKIEKPIPYSALIQQIKQLPILEDKPFQWQFSVAGRESSEFKFSSTPPAFMAASQNSDTSSFIFNGLAEQAHVGEYTVALTAQDLYSDKPITISLPFKVTEVDEPFEVTSKPITNLETDELYTYKLEVKDEESTVEDLRVFPINIPSFIVLDEKNKIFSGTPARKDVGTHKISIAIVDKGGHRVIHQWDVVVSEKQSNISGGSFGGWALLSLFMLAVGRRNILK